MNCKIIGYSVYRKLKKHKPLPFKILSISYSSPIDNTSKVQNVYDRYK